MTIKSVRTGWTGISALAGNPVLGDFESIQTVTVVGDTQAVIEFTNIPGTYQHLQIRGIARTDRSTTPTQDAVRMTFNGDTGANYSAHYLFGEGTTASAGGSSSINHILIDGFSNADSGGGTWGSCIIDILDYKNTNKFKTVRSISAWNSNSAGRIWLESGLWHGVNGTNAITSIRMVPNAGTNFVGGGTTFALYGIRG